MDDAARNLILAAEIAGLLHDLGKLRVPDEILEKPGVLEPDERQIIHTHSFETFQILRNIHGFEEITRWAAYHHEEPDGSGYPFQTSGETMGPLSKLISVADSVSAIIMRGGPGIFERVDVALRIVTEEFPRQAVSFITKTLGRLGSDGALAADGSYAERVLPTLQQLRSARLQAETLITGNNNLVIANVGQFTLNALRNIDKSLRATGVYEFSQLAAIESDPLIMGEICLVLKEVTWRLRNLARNIHLRTEKSGKPEDLAQVCELINLLGNPPTLSRLH